MKKKKYATSGGFVAFPHALLHHPNFWSLSSSACKLLLLIAAQYKGINNGDLQASWKYMQTRGWKSQDTLHRAKTELLAKGFIAETRKGAFPNKCSLYGITWQPLNPNTKFDISPNGFPAGEWNKSSQIALARNNSVSPKIVEGKDGIDTIARLRKFL